MEQKDCDDSVRENKIHFSWVGKEEEEGALLWSDAVGVLRETGKRGEDR